MKKKWLSFGIPFLSLLISSCDLIKKSEESISSSNQISSSISNSSSLSSSVLNEYIYGIEEEELTIHYLDLNASGDCILIDYGNYEILIDAGGNKRAGSEIIVPYLKQYVEDNTIELMIATHGHEDHIAGFVGLSNQPGVLKDFSFKTIVDLGAGYDNLTNKNAITQLQSQYNELRDAKIQEGTKYYTIRDIFDLKMEKWSIAPDFTFQFLKNKFYDIPYEKYTQNLNNYSICTFLKYQNWSYLFTGDLEKEGEDSLIELNQLEKVSVFKAGHHGSETASNENLLKIIQPDIAVFTADSTKESTYNFPHVAAIERLTQYTTTFYTSYYNGHLQFKMKKDSSQMEVECFENSQIFSYIDYIKSYSTIKAIASIGSKITASSLPAIEKAEELYAALTLEEKTYVYNYETLVLAREKYDSL